MVNLRIIWALIPIAAVLLLPGIMMSAEMTSTSYTISSTVLSGGGASSTATSYSTNSTVGQPTPLMDPLEGPISDNYDLYPGFWYTLAYYEVPKRSKSLPLLLLLLNE